MENIGQKIAMHTRDGDVYISDGFRCFLADEEDAKASTEQRYNCTMPDTKLYTEAIKLPTAQELRAEIKARKTTRTKRPMYELAPYFVVNLYYLLDMLVVYPAEVGYWSGKVAHRKSDGKFFAEGGIAIKDNEGDMLALVMPIAVPNAHLNIEYPAAEAEVNFFNLLFCYILILKVIFIMFR